MQNPDRVARLKVAIENRAFVRAKDAEIIHPSSGRTSESGWIFDIKAISLDPHVLDDVSALFWTHIPPGAYQIGGMETAAIPLAAALITSVHAPHTPPRGFYMRKSRKKDGLMKMIEGDLLKDVPIVLVDDLTNSGSSLRRQVEVLESLGHTVHSIFTLIRFRDLSYYTYFADKGIHIHALFELNDFKHTLDLSNMSTKAKHMLPQPYRVAWKYASPRPSLHLVVPKSDPALDEKHVFVGSDTGHMRALDQETGRTVWEYHIGTHPKGKGIFSSPAVHNGVVYFGGYDGNVYALDAQTGKRRWRSLEADWVGSSPALAPEHNLLFIGLEYGLWRKRGGIAALSIDTGVTSWRFDDMPCLTHATPRYISEHSQVAIGSNDGCVYLFDAVSGALLWKVATGILKESERDRGFSAHDIKDAVAYDAKRDLIIAANMNGFVFFIERATGRVRGTFQAEYGFFSTPVVYKDTVLLSSLDKHLYSVHLDTFETIWKWHAGARIFATPALLNGHIFIGSNTGRMTELDPTSGRELSLFQCTERITNRVAYNPNTHRWFMPTFANEVYCLEKRPPTDALSPRFS